MDERVFALTSRPDPALFFTRNDPNDPRLGELVRSQPEDYAACDIMLLGCPQDEGVRRNGGRPGAAHAPDEIRRCLYKLTTQGLESLRLFDLGNTLLGRTLEETHARQRELVSHLIQDSKTLVLLGGGNDLSWPDCAGLADAVGDVLAFNVDAHYDVRASDVAHSGTPYRQLLESGVLKAGHFFEMGSQPFANSPIYRRWLDAHGVRVLPLHELRAAGIPAAFETLLAEQSHLPVFWGLDMDVVRVADAPGVSAPNPTGLSGDDLCEIAAAAGGWPATRVLELTEVNPAFDVDSRTCRLAALALYAFLAARSAG